MRPSTQNLICAAINAALLVSLGLVVGLSYWPLAASLEQGACPITGLQKGLEYVVAADYGICYVDVQDGHVKCSQASGTYFTIDAIFAAPAISGRNGSCERSFKDGYQREADRDLAFNRTALDGSAIPCWYSTARADKCGLWKQDLLEGPSWGVAVMVLACVAALGAWGYSWKRAAAPQDAPAIPFVARKN
jgi:hypothetical protein